MQKGRCSVLIETYRGQSPSGIFAPQNAQPVEVALALRAKGWMPYSIRFEPEIRVWVAKVIDWGRAA
jgi:hypothetical protein